MILKRANYLLFGILSFLLPANIMAQSAFTTHIDARYTFDNQGLGQVIQTFSITNNTPSLFVSDYTFSLPSNSFKNLQAYTDNHLPLNLTTQNEANLTQVKITFPDAIVGKNKQRLFSLEYTDLNTVQKSGQVLEISIPRLIDPSQIDTYTVTLLVPLDIGEPVSLTPSPESILADPVYRKVVFTDPKIKSTGISALFGDKRVYDFALTYQLNNPTITPVITQIVLPPDTPYQSVFYDSILPPPDNISLDADGNWLATYSLDNRQSLTVTAKGKIIAYPKPINPIFPKIDPLKDHLQSSAWWPTNHPEITSLVEPQSNPQSLYQYVLDHLDYSYNRINQSQFKRLGVQDLLKAPQDALCLEYADFLITLLRAQGIPARLLIGFAYSENEKDKPIGLENNSLHAWVDWYDQSTSSWHPSDPTWGDTTGGLDYFTGWDVNHLVFAVQGIQADKPVPAGLYNQSVSGKNVTITISEIVPLSSLKIRPEPILLHLLPLVNLAFGKITFTNESNHALYNISGELTHDGRISSLPLAPAHLFPSVKYQIPVKYPYQNSQADYVELNINQNPTPVPIRPSYLLAGVITSSIIFLMVIFLIHTSKTRSLLVSKRQ